MTINKLDGHLCACGLFNKVISSDGLPYKKLEPDAFYDKFFATGEGFGKINLAAFDEGGVIGFVSVSYREGADTGFITFIAVDTEYRRRGAASKLLKAAEEACRTENASITQFRIGFQNPVNLEWFIPDAGFHDHPNAPGVGLGSAAHKFFLASGYEDCAVQDSFYRDISDYVLSDDIAETLDDLREKGVTVCFFDAERHGGLAELCDDLKSEDWRFHILGNWDKEKPEPMLVIAKDGKAAGFAGPLRVQDSGRGFFAGIAIHSEFRGMGAGKALFAALCLCFKEMGAGFMTLFTARDNFTRNIYIAAGFKVVANWVNMRKDCGM